MTKSHCEQINFEPPQFAPSMLMDEIISVSMGRTADVLEGMEDRGEADIQDPLHTERFLDIMIAVLQAERKDIAEMDDPLHYTQLRCNQVTAAKQWQL